MKINELNFASQQTYVKLALVIVSIFCVSIFTSVALTNLAVLGLVMIAPFAWFDFYKQGKSIDFDIKIFLGLIAALCVWDIFTNTFAGYDLGESIKALLHDLRTFGFILILWPIFTNISVARLAFFSVFITVLVLASINLLLTVTGFVPSGQYFNTGFMGMSHLSHMYGQALVGMFFVLAQMWLTRPKLSWRVALPMLLLLMSLFLASQRRTGYLMLAAGLFVWVLLNSKRLLVFKGKLWLSIAMLIVLILAFNTDVVLRRMELAFSDVHQFFEMTPEQRGGLVGSVSIRMQFAATMIDLIQHSNWLVGVGSLGFSDSFHAAAVRMFITPEAAAVYNWGNPHNEYLFMLATKGIIGLILYLLIFGYACRIASKMDDEVRSKSLLMFIFLFMLSITTNSMMIDMEEGHFTMAVLLIFLASQKLDLFLPLGGLLYANASAPSKPSTPTTPNH